MRTRKLWLNPNMFLKKNLFSAVKLAGNRDGFGDGLTAGAKKDERVVALCCDLSESLKMTKFIKSFPDRYFEIGVAEQNMAGIAAGMALSGQIPFIASYAAFSPGRNYDQIRVSIAYSLANVKIVGGHGGVSVGADGATHQMLEDISMMRSLPNMAVVVPADYWQAYQTTLAAIDYVGPLYFRLSRAALPQVTSAKTPFKIGRANTLTSGRDVTVVANGPLLYEALLAADILSKEGVRAEVIDSHTVKPLDRETILRSVKKTKAVVTAEEAQINGGLGSAVAELVSQEYPVPLRRVGVDDRFGQSGTAEELMKLYGMTSSDIVRAAKEVIIKKKLRR